MAIRAVSVFPCCMAVSDLIVERMPGKEPHDADATRTQTSVGHPASCAHRPLVDADPPPIRFFGRAHYKAQHTPSAGTRILIAPRPGSLPKALARHMIYLFCMARRFLTDLRQAHPVLCVLLYCTRCQIHTTMRVRPDPLWSRFCPRWEGRLCQHVSTCE